MTIRSTSPRPARTVRIEEQVDGIVSSIGPKLRQLRTDQRLSLQQLAVKADVSAAAIHKIEGNNMVPTITTMLKIASALDRPVGYFVDADNGPTERVALTSAAHRPAVFTPHDGLDLAGISGAYHQFRGAAAMATVKPGAHSGDRALIHPGEELVLVVEGRLVFDIAGERYDIGPGDSLHFQGDQAHHWANETSSVARAVWYALRDD